MWAIVVCSAVLVGLATAVARPVDPAALVAATVAATVALALGRRSGLARVLAAIVLAASLGALRATTAPMLTGEELAPALGRTVVLEGRVISAPDQRGETVTFDVVVDRVADAQSSGGFEISPTGQDEKVEVSLRSASARAIGIGDAVALRGRLAAPTSPAGFPRAELLRRRGVVATMSFPSVAARASAPPTPASGFARLRATISDGFNRYLPSPEAGLAFGSLLGGTASFDADFKASLQAAGLGHIVAVSGYNVVVVAGALAGVLARFAGRKWALVPILVGIAAYTALTGAPASAVRAALMVSAALVAAAVGRIADPLTGVLLAATAMAAWNPQVLQDVGFQLSVAATLGLVLLAPRFLRLLGRLPGWLAAPLAMTLSAQVATAPVVAATFHQVSLVAPLTNVLAAPVVPLLMAGAGVFALALPWPALASATAWLAGAPAAALAAIIHLGALSPRASTYLGDFTPLGALALAGVLLLWGLAGLPEFAPAVHRIRSWRWFSVAPLAGATVLLLGAALAGRPDGLLHVRVLASGAGQAYLVRGPDGSTVLVSGSGADPRGLASLVGDSLNAWEHHLGAALLLGENDEPLLAEALRRYPAGGIVTADREMRLDLDGAWIDVQPNPSGSDSAVQYGGVWIKLAGRPVPPEGATLCSEAGGDDDPTHVADVVVGTSRRHSIDGIVLAAPKEGALELVSDGMSLWWLGSDGETAG